MTVTCSQSSLDAAEPIAGTAVANTWRWLGLEHRPTWAGKAVEKAELPAAVRAWLEAFGAPPGGRVQLLRRPGHDEGPLTCLFADTRAGFVRRLALPDVDALAEVDLGALLAGDAGEPVTGPMAWVCTHGQRDACCGRLGGRVFTALRAELGDAVWQTSHLGGHRFAPTLLWLPEGLCYGRVGEDEVPALVAAARRGDVGPLDRLRGRVAWSAEAQAAESALRAALGEPRADALRLVDHGPGRVVLRHVGTDREYPVEVTRVDLGIEVVPSCGKPAEPGRSLTARILAE